MTRSAVTSRAAALFGLVLLGFLTETKFAVAFTIGRTVTTPFQSVHSSFVGRCTTQARIGLVRPKKHTHTLARAPLNMHLTC